MNDKDNSLERAEQNALVLSQVETANGDKIHIMPGFRFRLNLQISCVSSLFGCCLHRRVAATQRTFSMGDLMRPATNPLLSDLIDHHDLQADIMKRKNIDETELANEVLFPRRLMQDKVRNEF